MGPLNFPLLAQKDPALTSMQRVHQPHKRLPWLRLDRCNRARRVIVIGADDVTNPTLLEWIGAGFLAVGAATTESNINMAIKPFDKSRME